MRIRIHFNIEASNPNHALKTSDGVWWGSTDDDLREELQRAFEGSGAFRVLRAADINNYEMDCFGVSIEVTPQQLVKLRLMAKDAIVFAEFRDTLSGYINAYPK